MNSYYTPHQGAGCHTLPSSRCRERSCLWPSLLPKYSPHCCSPAKEGKKEKPGFVAFRRISLGPLIVGPEGGVG